MFVTGGRGASTTGGSERIVRLRAWHLGLEPSVGHERAGREAADRGSRRAGAKVAIHKEELNV